MIQNQVTDILPNEFNYDKFLNTIVIKFQNRLCNRIKTRHLDGIKRLGFKHAFGCTTLNLHSSWKYLVWWLLMYKGTVFNFFFGHAMSQTPFSYPHFENDLTFPWDGQILKRNLHLKIWIFSKWTWERWVWNMLWVNKIFIFQMCQWNLQTVLNLTANWMLCDLKCVPPPTERCHLDAQFLKYRMHFLKNVWTVISSRMKHFKIELWIIKGVRWYSTTTFF